MRAKITKRFLETWKPEPARDLFAFDILLPGFGVRMKPSGRASYFIVNGRKRFTFARVGVTTPDQARDRARGLLAEIEAGRDPSQKQEAMTVEALCWLYIKAAQAGLVTVRGNAKRARTVKADEGRVLHHIVPLIGKLPARDLDRPAVQRMVDAIAAGKTAAMIETAHGGRARVSGGPKPAARVVQLLGGLYTWAERRGYVAGVNPVRGVEKCRIAPRDRVLSADELARLGAALREREKYRPDPAATVIRLIALTGLRLGEACGLRREEIDLDAGVLRLVETKTGKSVRVLGGAAARLLEKTLAKSSDDLELVFPNRRGTAPLVMRYGTAAIFEAAGIKDAGAHCLRRTYASIAADLGLADSTIGALLGHAARGVTGRHYIARKPDAVMLAAADRVSKEIAAMLDGKGSPAK
jgi:integrase